MPFAFAWVLNNRLVTAAIAGPRTVEQLEDYLPALSMPSAPTTRSWWTASSRPAILDARLQRSGLPDRRAPDLDPSHPAIMIRRLGTADAEARLEDLSALLRCRPGRRLDRLRPAPWRRPSSRPTGGTCSKRCANAAGLCSAFEGETLIGSVQLGPEAARAAGGAEVAKLMVLRSHRGRGVGRARMQALLEAARASGRTLLLLDVRAGDPAERLLPHARLRAVQSRARPCPEPGWPARRHQLLLSAAAIRRRPMTAHLVQPSGRHAALCRRPSGRFPARRAGDRIGARIRQIETDFAAYVAAITDQTGRIRLPTGDIVPKVPFSVFWLVEDDEFIGEANIRHQLNAYLIKASTSACPSVAPAPGLWQADPGARARGVPPARSRARAGHLSP